jgi:elongation factor 1-beta
MSKTAQFGDLSTFDGLAKLDKYLASHSYIEGNGPTAADDEILKALGGDPDFSHVVRWWHHMNSFSEEERKSWPEAPAGTPSFGKKDKKEKAAASPKKAQKKKEEPKKAEKEEEDEMDLFGEDDEEDVAALKAKQEGDKKKKVKPPAMSSVIFNISPWDDEIDMKDIEAHVRGIKMEGLEWSTESKLITIAFGIKNLQIGCRVIDDLCSTEVIEEKILEAEDLIQSADIAAFVKL